jgi:hypothetical protein
MREIYIQAGGHSDVRIIIDKQEVFTGSTHASFSHQFSAGLHKIEVEFTNNWHTTLLDVKIIPKVQFTANSVLRNELSAYSDAEFWYAGVHGSDALFNEARATLAPSDKTVVLFMASYNLGVWDFSNTDISNVAAIVLSSFIPTATVKGLPESVDIYYTENLVLANSLYAYCYGVMCFDDFADLRQFMEGTLGITLTGYVGSSGADSVYIPEVVLDAQMYEQIEYESQRIIDEAQP